MAKTFCCPKGHECPSLEHVLRTLKLVDSDVLNVYMVGSHMWGTCGSRSDWDLVIVLKTLQTAKPLNTHKANIEAFILSQEQFIQSIADHLMQVLMVLWLPKECVWVERFDPRPSFKLDRVALAKALEHSRDRDLRVAEKHFSKGDRQKAKKVLLHCLRYLELGAQIRESGSVTEYRVASSHMTLIFSGSHEVGWSEIVAPVKRIMDQLWSRMIA